MTGSAWLPSLPSVGIELSGPPPAPRPRFAVMAHPSAWLEGQPSQPTQENEILADNQHAEPRTPLQSPFHEKRDDHTNLTQRNPPTRQNKSRQVYEIEALLKMRDTQGAASVLLRVKPEAIAENIFQFMGATSSRRLPARSRGLSDISNVSRGSDSFNPHDTIGNRVPFGSKPANLPRLQRQAPPPINIPPPQRGDGFERFLRQHASPPHHRVTAGGRIVPAGPMSPPPMLDYGSLNGLLRGREGVTDTFKDRGSSSTIAPKSNAPETHSMPSMNSRGYQMNQGDSITSQAGYPIGSTQSTVPKESFAYGFEPLITPSMQQTTTALTSIGTFLDGSDLVYCNGNCYRAYWNGVSTIMEPFLSFQQPQEQQISTPANVQVPYGMSYPANPMRSAQASNMSIPLMDASNGSQVSDRQTSDSLPNQPSNDKEKNLKDQLTNLDKHLALYHFQITPADRAQIIANRRYLVEAIDKIRVGKDQVQRALPIIEPASDVPIFPTVKLAYDRKTSASKPSVAQVRTSGRGLSPAAAPFVPLNSRKASGIPTKRTLEDVATAAVARKDKAFNAFDPSGSTEVSTRREESSSSVLDPSDPAMRVIQTGDIEYASLYRASWNEGPKRYCTEVAEFQEAIRQVREQARRYGCLGGQSKDPAYDAEQDIWWAICDREPIPVPATVPEYESHPRPWSWADSFFNFRHKEPQVTSREGDEVGGTLNKKLKNVLDTARSYSTQRPQQLHPQRATNALSTEEDDKWDLVPRHKYLDKNNQLMDVKDHPMNVMEDNWDHVPSYKYLDRNDRLLDIMEDNHKPQARRDVWDSMPQRSYQPYVEDYPETPTTIHHSDQKPNKARGPKDDSTSSPKTMMSKLETPDADDEDNTMKAIDPTAANTHSAVLHDQDTHKAGSDDTRESQISGARSFLRKMLQSPVYSTDRAPTGVSTGLADRLSKLLRGGGDCPREMTNKENALSRQSLQPMQTRLPLLKSDPSTSITKAQPSLVSPTPKDHADRTDREERGNAQTISPHQPWHDESPSRRLPVPVSLPFSNSYIQPRASSPIAAPQDGGYIDEVDAIAARYASMGFGLDGGADAKQSPSRFNYKGVTHADFETKRESPNTAEHKKAVEEFLHESQQKSPGKTVRFA